MSNVGGVRNNNPVAGVDTPETAASSATSQREAVTLGSSLFKDKPALAQVASGQGEIAFGARGDGARLIQQALKQLGNPTLATDGIFGRGTQTAVAAFQRANGLNPSGAVDSQTLAKLDQKLAASGTPTPPRPSGPVDSSILFVGMGDYATHEAAHLKKQAGVTAITDSKVGDDKVTLTVGGQRKEYDLASPEGCKQYATDIGLRGAKADEVAGIINAAGSDARDEVAQIAKAFKEAEDGKRNIERMVISGHSVGGGVWGDTNGYLALQTISGLAKAFPAASRQVQDFMVAGCYSGGESAMEKFRGMFPNLKTSWAYTGSAPGSWSGAMPHLSAWEGGTKGSDPSALSRNLAAGMRKGENVAVWTATKGYDDGQPMRPLADVARELEVNGRSYDGFFKGDSVVDDTQSGPLRNYYNSIQRMLQHPQLAATDRPELEKQRDVTIRLNFYDATIKGKFQGAHAEKINAGFRALGMEAPDFSQLSRSDALAKVREFEAKLNTTNPKPAAAQTLKPLLTDGLRDLKNSQIPNTWV